MMKKIFIFTFFLFSSAVISFGQIYFNSNLIVDPTGSAIGENNFLQAPFNTGIGTNNLVNDFNGMALGHNQEIIGVNSFGFGRLNVTNATNALGLGVDNTITGDNSMGVGFEQNVTGLNSLSFGRLNQVNASDAMVLGRGLVNNLDNNLMLGMNNTPNPNVPPAITVASNNWVGIFRNQNPGQTPGSPLQPGSPLEIWGPNEYQYAVMDMNVLAGNKRQSIFMVPNLGYGFFNHLSQENDKGLFWNDSNGDADANLESGLVIAPWYHGGRGLRISNEGTLKVLASDSYPYGVLEVQVKKGAHIQNVFTVPNLSYGSFNGLSRDNDKGIFWTDSAHGPGHNEDAGFVIGPWRGADLGMRITSEGNVGIGVADPTKKLTVNGGAHFMGSNVQVRIGAEEIVCGPHTDYRLAVDGKVVVKDAIVVTPNCWADFVFAPDYQLPSLEETESYIVANGHLPGIPSEQTVMEEGVDLTEMNIKLLQKVEELTLHIIELNKKIESLEE